MRIEDPSLQQKPQYKRDFTTNKGLISQLRNSKIGVMHNQKQAVKICSHLSKSIKNKKRFDRNSKVQDTIYNKCNVVPVHLCTSLLTQSRHGHLKASKLLSGLPTSQNGISLVCHSELQFFTDWSQQKYFEHFQQSYGLPSMHNRASGSSNQFTSTNQTNSPSAFQQARNRVQPQRSSQTGSLQNSRLLPKIKSHHQQSASPQQVPKRQSDIKYVPSRFVTNGMADEYIFRAGPSLEDALLASSRSAQRNVNQGVRKLSQPHQSKLISPNSSPYPSSNHSMKSYHSKTPKDQYQSFLRRELPESCKSKVVRSFVLSVILEYLRPDEIIRFQSLSRYFYYVQIPRCFNKVSIISQKQRMHLLNQDYVLLFDFNKLVKSKIKIRSEDFQPLWNQQSIEIRGKIYMTGGAVANTKTYLKQTSVLDETTMSFTRLADMNYQRDAHGITSWLNRYIIVVGSWHGNDSIRTCEIYDVTTDRWTMLPDLNDGTCAPGLIVVKDRYLYKLGGTSDIGKVEMLDLKCPKQWITINTCNKFGRKHTINRCLLFELPRNFQAEGIETMRKFATSNVSPRKQPAGYNFPLLSLSASKSSMANPFFRLHPQEQDPYIEESGKFLVLGCHFGRSEKPFIYDILGNKYHQFSDKETFIDMYRSNDVVQFNKKGFYIRPFVKVGEKAKSVKVYQYFLEDTDSHEADIRIQQLQKLIPVCGPRTCTCRNEAQSIYNPEDNICVRQKAHTRKSSECLKCSQASVQARASGGELPREENKQMSLFSRVANLFSKRQYPSETCYDAQHELIARKRQIPFKEIKKGTMQEQVFAIGQWDSDSDNQ